MKSRAAWTLVLAFCAVAALLLFYFISRTPKSGIGGDLTLPTRSGQPIEPSVLTEGVDNAPRAQAPVTAVASSASSAPSSAAIEVAPTTTGSILASFYGAEWEQVRPEIEKRISLSIVPDIPLPAWESVLDSLQAAMRVSDAVFARWRIRYAPPDPISLEYLANQFSVTGIALDERDIAALESIFVEPRAEVQGLLERLRAVCDEVLARKFRLGQYNYGPFASIRTDQLPKAAFYADSTGLRGWSVSWGIGADEDPELEVILTDLLGKKKEFALLIQEYLDSQR